MTHTASLFFLIALAATTALRLWLSLRHQHHVARHREIVPIQFAAAISLEDHRKAADYTIARQKLEMAETAFSFLLLVSLTLGGLLQWCSEAAGWIVPSGTYGRGLLLFGLLGLISFGVDLPFAIYRTFVVESSFGFNRTGPRLFVLDQIKQIGLAVVVGTPLLLAVLWLMNRMGAYWWLWVWLFWLGFNLLALICYPTVIAPLFNKFIPLADQAVRQRIEALLARCGFRSGGLFVMDGSRRSSHGNAYFSGLGAAKRIVFFDTLLERLQPAEVEAVLAHEIGHFRHHHIWKRIALMALTSLALLWLLGQLMQEPLFFAALGVDDSGTAMALILFSLVLPVMLFPLMPLFSALSRHHEYQADAYAALQTRNTDLISALVKLYRENAATLTPDPLHSLFNDSHPPASLRIARLEGLTA